VKKTFINKKDPTTRVKSISFILGVDEEDPIFVIIKAN